MPRIVDTSRPPENHQTELLAAWDRLQDTRRASAPDPRGVLEAVAQAPVEEAPAVGLGCEHRLAGRAVAGAALVVEDTVAHLMAFPLEA